MTNKCALLIGINYINQQGELRGCINDALDVKDVLVNKFDYNEKNIVVLTDDANDKKNQPTRNNILRQFVNIARKAIEGKVSSFFIHYSGHGYYQKDTDGDEKDNYDEVLCPVDYDKKGFVTDDILNMIMKVFPESCDIFALFDCCHSGTMLDLKYKYFDENEKIASTKNVNSHVVMLSGCRDDQTSADAYISGKFCGAMTKSFLSVLKGADYCISYFDLLKGMRYYLEHSKFSQIPQLTSSKHISANSMFCQPKIDDAFASY